MHSSSTTVMSRCFAFLFLLVFSCAVLKPVHAQDDETSSQDHMKSLVGTWVITRVNVDGKPITHRYQIKPGKKEGEFEHVWRVTGNEEKGDSLWEGRFKVTPASRTTLAVNYVENKRILPEDKAHDWQPFDLSYVAQVTGEQLYTQRSLDREPWIWTRENSGMNVQDPKRLEVLAPLSSMDSPLSTSLSTKPRSIKPSIRGQLLGWLTSMALDMVATVFFGSHSPVFR